MAESKSAAFCGGDVADIQHGRIVRHGLQERVHQHHVDHRRLVDHKEIAIKRAFVDLAPGDFTVAELLPLALGNGRDRRLHPRVLIRADHEDLAGFLAPIEDRSLSARTVPIRLPKGMAPSHVFAETRGFRLPEPRCLRGTRGR